MRLMKKKAITETICLECLCMRCGHRWVARGKVAPKLCPNQKCHSPNWTTPKKVKKEGK